MQIKDSTYKISLGAVTIENGNTRARALLEEVEKKSARVPNMYKNMANLPALLETYNKGYNLFRQEGGFTPEEQEVILLTISRENGCEYCMAAHSFLADKASNVPEEITEAIRNNTEIADKKLRALSVFTRIMVNKRGRPDAKDAERFLVAGYAEKQILSIILAISVKILSNYSNHIFRTEVDSLFVSRKWNRSN